MTICHINSGSQVFLKLCHLQNSWVCTAKTNCCTKSARVNLQRGFCRLGAIHIIPEWLSFWDEFIPSPYYILCLFTWYRNDLSFLNKSFLFSFQMKFSLWYEISLWCQVNWKRTSFRIENRKSCSLGWVAHDYLICRENHASALACAVRFYHLNAVRTSLWNDIHSRMKVIQVSYKQSLKLRCVYPK